MVVLLGGTGVGVGLGLASAPRPGQPWPNPPTVQVTGDYGSTWSDVSPRGLSPLIESVQAADADTAWAMVDGGVCGLVGTSDGGANWYPVCPGISSSP